MRLCENVKGVFFRKSVCGCVLDPPLSRLHIWTVNRVITRPGWALSEHHPGTLYIISTLLMPG